MYTGRPFEVLVLYISGFQTGVRIPKGVRDGFPRGPRKHSEKCLHGFFTIYDPYVFKFAHISQSLSLIALRGSVAVVWYDRLSVDVS